MIIILIPSVSQLIVNTALIESKHPAAKKS
jgi:hypothetical protein